MCAACAANTRSITSKPCIAMRVAKRLASKCQVCNREASYICTSCGTYICFSIFDTRYDMRCHDIHMVMCRNSILGSVNARCLYGMLTLSKVIQSIMNQLIRTAGSTKKTISPFLEKGIRESMKWIQRNLKDLIMTTVVIFFELILNTLTLGGDLGIPPLSIGLGMSLITLYIAPVGITAIVGTVVVYLLINLHSSEETTTVNVTPKRRIQRKIDDWSPLGALEIEVDPESDIKRIKMKLYILTKKVVGMSLILILIGFIVYTLQGCGPGDDEEIDALVLAYTILTYNEGIRLMVAMMIGILLGNTCLTCRDRPKPRSKDKKEPEPENKEEIKKKESPMIRLSVVQEVLYAMKTEQLSALCERIHIPKSGLKGDIIERIIKHMRERLEPAHKEAEYNK